MIEISNLALGEVLRLRARAAVPETALLRLDITQSGCSGWSYQMNFVDTSNAEDHVFDCGPLRVVVAPNHLPYLKGLTIDYAEDLMGGSFRFRNPQATSSCSCGYSFALETDAD